MVRKDMNAAHDVNADAHEVLHHNDNVRVTRRLLPDGEAVIVKEAISAQAIGQLGHEVAMLQRVAHVDGVAKISEMPTESNVLILKANVGVSLANFLQNQKFNPAQAVTFSYALVRILVDVHKAGILHQDICPANLLVDPDTLEPTLIDFNLASDLRELQTASHPPTGIVGTLSYMSPEKTGRTGRIPDQRSDLYSLGITLYELLTQHKPFESQDLLELVHAHLVQVPQAPSVVNPEVPQIVSDLVMRLLEKEPDKRYQSADGLAQDLKRLSTDTAPFPLGQFDFGTRLNPPTQLMGREAEIQALRDAMAHTADGRTPCVMLSGPAGVGKTALLAELRPMVAAQHGWVLSESFEQFRQDARSVALQSLGRQLLAEPEVRLAQHRECILKALGNNLGLGPSLLPEFMLLLGKHDAIELSDPREAEARSVQATVALLRSVASAERPIVILYDDVHWASSLTLRLLDAVVTSSEPILGLLMVCTFRANEALAGHPLNDLIERWKKLDLSAPHIAVDNLANVPLSEFVGTMLRMVPEQAVKLVDVLSERTQNNPYNTVEVLNALRQDGLLAQKNGVWEWDAAAIRRHVGNSNVADLLARRLGRLPADTLETLQVIACLGGLVEQEVLGFATALDKGALQERLATALDDGLLLHETGDTPRLKFSHGRVQQAVFDGMPADARTMLHLVLARCFMAHHKEHPELEAIIAQQYLSAVSAVSEEAERRRMVELFDRAAHSLGLLNSAASEGFLGAALTQLEIVAQPEDIGHLIDLQARHHLTLYGIGRLEEADVTYARMAARGASPIKLAEVARNQMYSMLSRAQFKEAVALGLDLMADLGLPKPDDVGPEIDAGFIRLAAWIASDQKLSDFDKPVVTDPRVLALGSILSGVVTASFFCDLDTFAWLLLEAHRLWVEYGPAPQVMSSVGSVCFLLVNAPQDYRGAYEATRHIIAVGEARRFEPGTSVTRCVLGLSAGHWVEPIESMVKEFRRAREDLTSAGEVAYGSYTFLAVEMLLDYEASLEAASNEVEQGLSYVKRTGNEASAARYRVRQQLIRALRGETTTPGGFTDTSYDEEAYVRGMDPKGTPAATYHIVRSISAAIFGDIPRLIAHSDQAIALVTRAPGYYLTALARAVRCMALGEQARALPTEERASVVAELDGLVNWMRLRAADAPGNFLHLQRWVEAERAWAAETVWVAGAAFDAAVAESLLHKRPWHMALIHERAAQFLLLQGMEEAARPLMVQACQTYEAWGAAGKVKELRRKYAFLRVSKQTGQGGTSQHSAVVDSEMVDMMGVLRASQALSSETSLSRLTTQIGKVLGALTGATGVYLVVRPEEGSNAWVMASSLGEDKEALTVDQAGARGEVPLSAFRYAERTKELLVIDDAPSDERFSGDPYVQKFAQCSLVLAPILKQGQLNAMLVLENHQRRAAFSAERLNSVNMIGGQLAVSLDNALLYASLEKRVAERTSQLHQKTNDINAMLQNMPQGVLTVVPGGTIHPEYSAYLETIFETKDVASRPVMELVFGNTSLGADALSQIDASVSACIGEDEMNFECNSHLLASEFDLNLPDGRIKSLELSWSPICDEDGVVGKLMVCVRDVTELKRLEVEANTRKRELQMIGEILAVSQEKFHEFIDSAKTFLDENNRLIEQAQGKSLDAINLLFRNMHTIKGNARTYGLLGLTNLVHVAEQSYDDLRKNDQLEWPPSQLLEELESVKAAVQKYSHVNDSVLGRKGPGRRVGVEKYLMVEKDTVQQAMQLLIGVDQDDSQAMRAALARVGSMLNLIGTQSLRDVLAGSLESLPSLARELGKEPPRVEIEDHGVVVRTQVSALLRNLFTHLLRNSVDHGIEKPEARLASGKPAEGCISLALAVDDARLWIRLRDDGRGLAVAKIRQRAVEQGLITSDAKTSPEEVAQLIFRSGFSTAEQVTEVSGRGVGMDAVKGFLENEGGTITIEFLDNNEDADFRAIETVIALPDKYAASLSTALSFDALRARSTKL
jgi:GAF domain-containing protein/HPt (histidine-containing phosphotransfer) domain-containing protein